MQGKKAFHFFLRTYLIIFVIPIVIALVNYQFTIHQVQKDVYENTQSVLNSIADNIDKKINTTHDIVYKVWTLLSTSGIASARKGDMRLAQDAAAFQSELINTFLPTIDYEYDLYVFLKDSDAIISKNNIYFSYDTYFDSVDIHNMDKSAFVQLLSQPAQKETMAAVSLSRKNKDPIDYLLYVAPFQDELGQSGAVAIFLRTSTILQEARGSSFAANGNFYIFDDVRHALLSSAPLAGAYSLHDFAVDANTQSGYLVKQLGGEKSFITYTNSAARNWCYVGTLPYSAVRGRVLRFSSVNIIVLTAGFLLALLLSIYYAYIKSKPVENLFRVLSKTVGAPVELKSNDVEQLDRRLSEIIYDNEHMRKKSQQQIPMIRDMFLGKLFQGDFTNEAVILNYISQCELPPLPQYKFVLLMEVSTGRNFEDNLALMGEVRDTMREILESLYETVYYDSMDYNRFAFMIGCGAPGGLLRDDIGHIAMRLYETYQADIAIGVSACFEQFSDAYGAVTEAQEALNMIPLDGRRASFYDDIAAQDSLRGVYYYPQELESKLTDHIRRGDNNAIIGVFNKIYSENMMKHQISAPMVQCLVYDIRCTLLKLLGSIKLKNEQRYGELLDEILQTQDQGNLLQTLYQYQTICESISSELQGSPTLNKTAKNTQAIMDYLDAHYTEPDLTLTGVAEKFFLSPQYLSKIFKDYTQSTFSAYVESLRMKQAVQLLRAGENVELIAYQVGYKSVSAFRKSFKKTYGCAPSSYSLEQSGPTRNS